MKLSEEQFNQLIKDLPSINISLEWEGTEGYKNVEGYEINSGRFLVFVDFEAYSYATYYAGDYYVQPSFEIDSYSIQINSIDDFINDDCEEYGEEVTFTEKQYKKLFNVIENLIETE